MESSADQKTAQRKAFGDLVNAKGGEQRPSCSIHSGSFVLNSQSQSVCRAMNRQRNNQRCGDFAEMPRCVFVKMAGRASRTNVMDMFANKKEERISGSQR